MNLEAILNIIASATNLTKGLASLVDGATQVFHEADAAKVKTAANALKAENDRLTEVVLAKLG